MIAHPIKVKCSKSEDALYVLTWKDLQDTLFREKQKKSKTLTTVGYFFVGKEEKKYFTMLALYSRRIYKKPIKMVIFKVNLKNRVVAEGKEALRPRGSHHKDTGASFKGFP